MPRRLLQFPTSFCMRFATHRAAALRPPPQDSAFPHVMDSIQVLAASDCDVVHVLLPPALHIEAAMAMVESGKSVFSRETDGTQ